MKTEAQPVCAARDRVARSIRASEPPAGLRPKGRRRSTGSTLIAVVLSVTLLVNVGAAKPAAATRALAADAGCASFGSSFAAQPIDADATGLRLGCARDAEDLGSLASSDDDLVAAIDFNVTQRPNQWLRTVNRVVAATLADMTRGLSLSQALTLRAQRDSVGFFPQTADVWFGGSIHVVGHSVVLVVPAGDIGTAGFWDGFWKKVVTGVVVVATAALVGAACLLAFNVGAPAAAPVCGAVAGGLSGGVGELVSAALDGRPIDAEVWGAAVGTGMMAAVGGALGGVLLQYLSTGTRGLLVGLQKTLRHYATVFKFWRVPLNYLATVFNPAVAQRIIEVVARATRGVGADRLTVMPLGDSITWGFGSSDGSGYLEGLRTWAAWTSAVGLVGSQHSGPDALANEGHSGWTIGDITRIADSALVTYRPNVVLLHIGTSDLIKNVDPAYAVAQLAGLIDQIFRSAPGVTLVVSTIVPSAYAPLQRRIVRYNLAIPGVVAARQRAGKHVKLVDMNAVTTANLADVIHPNDRGYQKMAIAFYLGILSAAPAPAGSVPPGPRRSRVPVRG